MKSKFIWVLFFCCTIQMVHGQKPVIEKIEPLNTYPEERILISGSGFSATSSQLEVWFGPKLGTITNSTDFTITVTVPPQAKMDHVEVINRTSGLSAKSQYKFMPSYSGTEFTAANLSGSVLFSNANQNYDLCLCDLNNDNRPDVVASRFGSGASDFMVLLNKSTKGSISFDPPITDISGINLNSQTAHIICGDLDGDGKPDVIAVGAGPQQDRVFILKNDGSMNFSAGPTLLMDVGDLGWKVKLHDLNADGRKDVIVTNAAKNNFFVFENKSTINNLEFGAPIKILMPSSTPSYGIEIQDFDGDKKPDIVINRQNGPGLYIFRNNSTAGGDIAFHNVVTVATAGSYNSITSADFDGKNGPDLVVTNLFSSSQEVFIFYNNTTAPGPITFRSTPFKLTATNGPLDVEVADINGDKHPDIIVSNLNTGTVNVYLHNGNYETPGFTSISIPTSHANRTVKISDLDGDAKPDMVLASANASSPYTIEIKRNTNCHKPVILTPPPYAICSGDAIVLRTINAPSVTSYQWIRDGNVVSTGTSPTFSVTQAGNWAVRGISESGACTGSVALSQPVSVISSASNITTPVINTNPANAQVCTGSTLGLSTANAGAGASYVWTGPNNFSATTSTPSTSVPNMQQVNAGYYNLQVVVGSCSKTAEPKLVQVVNLQSFTVEASPSLMICQGGSTTLSVPQGYTYQWYRNDATISTNGTSYQYVATQAGNYKVKVSNGSCDYTTAPVTVVVLSQPTANFNAPTEACTFQQLSFESTSTGLDNVNGTPSYEWDFGNGAKIFDEANPKYTYNSSGSFTLSLKVGYKNVTGCTHTYVRAAPLVVTSSVAPTIVTNPPNITSMCPGEEVTLSISNADNFTSITWSPGGANPLTITQPNTYVVNTVASNGCVGQAQKIIASKPVPVLSVSASPTQIQRGQSAQLLASGADTYKWSPAATLNNATIDNPIATPASTTEYTVEGTITGQCPAVAKIKITVGGGITLNAPAAFTPNGDGQNETWVIPDLEEYGDCSMSIFDGRGRRIFQQAGYTPWDGTSNGKQVPAGTYYYVFACPGEKPATGSVLVVR
jgi:gliding motility-associated-like protein